MIIQSSFHYLKKKQNIILKLNCSPSSRSFVSILWMQLPSVFYLKISKLDTKKLFRNNFTIIISQGSKFCKKSKNWLWKLTINYFKILLSKEIKKISTLIKNKSDCCKVKNLFDSKFISFFLRGIVRECKNQEGVSLLLKKLFLKKKSQFSGNL